VTGRRLRRVALVRALAALAACSAPWAAPALVAVPSLPHSSLAVWHGDRWVAWWRSAQAPARWNATPTAPLGTRVRWRAAAGGVEWGELRLAGSGEAWRFRVVVARLDPARLRLTLAASPPRDGRRGTWTIDAAGPDAVLAVNAGQFRGATPWGWVVHEGREYRAPGNGPLAPAIVVDSGGACASSPADSILALRAGGAVREAFQSYPALLAGGAVPAPLQASGRGSTSRTETRASRSGRSPTVACSWPSPASMRSPACSTSCPPVPPSRRWPPSWARSVRATRCSSTAGSRRSCCCATDAGDDAPPHRWPGLRSVPLGLVATAR
jgi:hypothetical protein